MCHRLFQSMPRPLRVEGRVLSSSLRRSREMWIHFVFKIQCSGKGCICRRVFDSVALRRYYCWVKSCFCSWWESSMASKHAGLKIGLWLKHLVRIFDCGEEEGADRLELTFYCVLFPNLLTLSSFSFFLFCFVSCGPGEAHCHAVVCLCTCIFFFAGRQVATSISTRHRRCYEAACRLHV